MKQLVVVLSGMFFLSSMAAVPVYANSLVCNTVINDGEPLDGFPSEIARGPAVGLLDTDNGGIAFYVKGSGFSRENHIIGTEEVSDQIVFVFDSPAVIYDRKNGCTQTRSVQGSEIVFSIACETQSKEFNTNVRLTYNTATKSGELTNNSGGSRWQINGSRHQVQSVSINRT